MIASFIASIPLNILIIYLLFILIFAIIVYICLGIALMQLAQRFNVKNAWISWVPFIQIYMVGAIAYRKDKKLIWIFFISSFIPDIYFAISSNYIILNLLITCYTIFLFVTLHKIYEKISNKPYILTFWTVISLGILYPFLLVCNKDNKVNPKKHNHYTKKVNRN